ncbi:MAG: caspase domain-containing protein [Lachnospiraceae bacterium]
MNKTKKGLLLAMFALFAVLTLPMSTKAMTVETAEVKSTSVAKSNILTTSTNAVTVKKGKTAVVTVCFKPTNFSTLRATASNSNVSLKWGGWSAKNNKLIITGLKAGTTTIKLTSTYNAEYRIIKVTVKAPNPVVYRAAVIGQYDYNYNNDLPACKNDAIGIAYACKKSGYSVVKAKFNTSAAGMKDFIASTFSGADSNDVSLFFYSGHGASDGSLCTVESYYDDTISMSYISSWLSQVPGTVIVLLDSCHSGSCINKSADGKITFSQKKAVTKSDLNAFNNSVVNAFAKADAKAKAASSKTGELCTSKFRVITACSKYEYSWCNSSYSYFSYYTTLSAGVDYFTGAAASSSPADSDGNGVVTINECYNYVRANTAEDQSAQVYPTNCTTRIFKR